jgi:aspartyl protease family protein
MRWRRLRVAFAAGTVAAATAALAQGLTLAGRMGERALLIIDGRPHTLAVGQTAAGVRLLRWAGDSAEVERGGSTYTLRLGAAPAQVGTTQAPSAGREIIIPAAPGGHFVTRGSINGRSASFMVDTGATMVSIGRSDAERLGLDLTAARQAVTQTANGPVLVQTLTLGSVRVGEVELNNVNAIVLPSAMPYVLLGNSWLGRFQMRRENDIMRLELR